MTRLVVATMTCCAPRATAASGFDAFAAVFGGRKSIPLIDARAEAVATLRRSPSYAICMLKATIRWTVVVRSVGLRSVVRFDGDRVVPILLEGPAAAVVAAASRTVGAIRGDEEGGGMRPPLDPARQDWPLRFGVEGLDRDPVTDRATPVALAADDAPSCPPPPPTLMAAA